MSETREIIIVKPLVPDLLADYLAFFDGEAFANNPEWAGCYCYFNHAQHNLKPWEERTPNGNRTAASMLIEGRQMSGYMAYVGRRVVGWCNAGPRARYTTLDNATEPELDKIGSIMCFIVAPEFRRQGVATFLLDAACMGMARLGLTIAEAYPRQAAQTDAGHYHGPLSMYLENGFEVVSEEGGVTTVRKSLVVSN